MKSFPVLLFLLLSACDHRVTEYPHQPPITQNYQTDEVYLTRVRLNSVDELKRFCPNLSGLYYGCAKARFETIAPNRTYSLCTIYVLSPKDFNDLPKLAIQGHELEHCFGRMH